jgi:PAS domain S-box-containing protein
MTANGSARESRPIRPHGPELDMASLFASFLESMSNCAIAIAEDGTVAYANRAALGLFGKPKTAVLGRPVEGAFRGFLDRVQRQGGGSDTVRVEHFYDGYWYIVQYFPLLSTDGVTRTPYRVLTATDISERKSREFEFLEIAAGLEEATRIAEMGTFKVLWDTGATQWSPHAYIIHGVRPDTFTPGRDAYRTLIHPEDRDYVIRSGSELTQGRPAANVQYRIIRPDGVIRWMRMDGRILFDANGVGYASFGTVQDISDAKQREQELQELLKRNAILYEALEASPIGVAVLTPDPAQQLFVEHRRPARAESRRRGGVLANDRRLPRALGRGLVRGDVSAPRRNGIPRQS